MIGGPPLHAGYVRRLFQAEAAGKIAFNQVVVVDRDPGCAAAGLVGDRVRLEVEEWTPWLSRRLSGFGPDDHLVPYHWAPHVLLDWLVSELARKGVSAVRSRETGEPPARPPFLRGTREGDLALSYAEWLCPPACIEPALCPHTRGPKSWSLAGELHRSERSFVFPCTHLAQGVGTIPVRSIFGVRDRILAALESGDLPDDRPIWIGSASHCHGLSAPVILRRQPLQGSGAFQD